MKQNFQEPTAKASARRRLVRGAFAAPAAISLYSGSAFAITSLSCVAKDVGAMQEPQNQQFSDTDTYVRVRLYNLTKNGGAVPPQVIGFIKGADLVFLNAPSTYLGNSDWQCYSLSNVPNNPTPPFSAGQILYNTVAPAAPGWTFNPVANGMYVAIRVDVNGNIKGVVGLQDGSSGYAVHQSCWASFRPTTP